MPDTRKAKRLLLFGAVVGAALSLCITLLMDTFYAESLNGTWRDAIVNDLNNFLKVQTTVNSPLVYIIFGIILIVLSGFGAFMGMIFSFLLIKFFSFLKG